MTSFIKRKIETLTLGEKLKKIREKSGVSLVEMASQTKIKKDYLEKIEAGDYKELPFDVYVKGFLRSYAKYLNLDPEKVITQFNKEVGVRENIKKYQENKKPAEYQNKFPSLIITPRIASVFFTALIVLVGFSYFYLEVDSFSKEPQLIIEAPISDEIVKGSSVEIMGKTDFENKITINNEPIFVDSEGKFREKVGLQKGVNEIIIEAFNSFEKNTQKKISLVADYDPVTSVAGEKNENLEENQNENSFEIEIESKEDSIWLSYKVDNQETQEITLHSNSSLKIKAEDQIEISSGKANNTYVKINNGEFFLLDEEIEGFKTINLNKKGVISEEIENSEANKN